MKTLCSDNHRKTGAAGREKRVTAVLLAVIMMAMFPVGSFAAESDSVSSAEMAMSVDLHDMTEESAITDELLVLAEKGTAKGEIAAIADDAGASLDTVKGMNDGTRLAKISLDEAEDAQTVADEMIAEESVLLVQPNYIYTLYGESANEESANREAATEDGGAVEASGEEAAVESDATASDMTSSDTTVSDEVRLMVDEKIIDSRTITQWYMGSLYSGVRYKGSMNGFDAIKSLSNTDGQATVAVIDTGAKLDHPDLEDNIIKEKCITYNRGKAYSFTALDGSYDDDGHGTHVCGIIAAKGDDDLGISGVAGNRAKLIVIDAALKTTKSFTTEDVVLAINYAVRNGADIINMSIGGLYRDYIMEDAVNAAYGENVLCVCAAGNERSDLAETPGDSAGAVSVMAHNENGTRANFSNYGPEKDVSAPGTDIVSTYINVRSTSNLTASYKSLSGTSMAAPVVTGMAALIKSENSDLNARELKNLIYTSGGSSYTSFGFGKVDATVAVKNAKATSAPSAIKLNRSTESMYPGETVTLEYAVYPASASVYSDEVSFSSSNPAAATVDPSGKVSANAPGTAVITATCQGKTARCSIDVSDITYEKISRLPFAKTESFSPSDPTIKVMNKNMATEVMADGYYMDISGINGPVEMSVSSGTATPHVRVFGPAGDEIKVTSDREKSGRTINVLKASFTPEMTGRYKIQVMGETDGGTDVNKTYGLEVDSTCTLKSAPVVKKANTLTVKGKSLNVKRTAIKKKAKIFSRSKLIVITKAKGKVTYSKVSGSSRIKINKTTGKVTIKKKTARGTYKARIKVSAAGNSSYKAGSKTVTIKVKVK